MANDPTRKIAAFDPERVMNAREHRLTRLRYVKTHLTVLTTPGTPEQCDLSSRNKFYLRLARWLVDQAIANLSLTNVLPSRTARPAPKEEEKP